jgi:DNA ligase 1
MDLTKFTNKTPAKENKKEIIIDNNEVTITKTGNEIEFIIKNKDGLSKYQDYLFFSQTNSIITESEEKAQKFFSESIERGTEGLMFKNLNSSYKPGIRTGAMAKLKESKEDIDVVILAAEHGKGKRAGFYSSFFVGVKNEDYTDDSDKFLNIGKVSSGIKEIGEDGHSMDNLTKILKPLKIKEVKGITYFEPKIIIQVRYQEIQKSTSYNSGYALRFPRIISLREDKDIEEINSIEDIKHFI